MSKSSLTIPSVVEYSDYRSFLTDFWEANKALNFFSSRYLALKLDWSASYFHDVMSGRKKFSIPRAVELANYLELSLQQTDYLILMVLKDMEHELTSEYVAKRIAQGNFT
jgi:uncharacterized protein (TIGR02147 family)